MSGAAPGSPAGARPSLAAVQRWLGAWDAQQEHYAVERDQRWDVVLDAIGTVVGTGDHVVDLGCGPGTLTARIVERYPGVHVVGVDADPFLVELARQAHPDGVTWVAQRFDSPTWADALGSAGTVRAAVTSSAFHYLDETALTETYGHLASLIRPGGLLVNADHLLPSAAPTHPLLRAVSARRRLPPPPDDPWQRWWRDVATDPEIGPVLARHHDRDLPGGDHAVPVERHVELLTAAGFRATDVVWRHGVSAVLVALR